MKKSAENESSKLIKSSWFVPRPEKKSVKVLMENGVGSVQLTKVQIILGEKGGQIPAKTENNSKKHPPCPSKPCRLHNTSIKNAEHKEAEEHAQTLN